jgi:Fur family zinc uptake transcriptional regulator
VAEQLAEARRYIEAQGEWWTEPRARTLQLLLEAGGPIGAYQMLALYRPTERAPTPSTIYRALQFLIGLGLVERRPKERTYLACLQKIEEFQR